MKSPFVWGSAGQAMTPEQVARRRAMAALLQNDSSSTAPVGHWTQAAARGLGGYLSGRSERIAGRAEEEGLASADAAVMGNPVLSALMGGNQMTAPAVAGGVAPAAAMPGEARAAPGADAIRAGLVQRGLPGHVADAFVMNFQDESALNPGIEEGVANVHGTKGFGLAQWTGPRRDALTSFAQQRGAPVSDVDTQLDFLMTELQGPESRAAQSILSAQDAPTAAAAILNDFLRPAEEHRARREAAYLDGAAPSIGGGTGVATNTPQAPSGVVAALIAAQQNPWVAQKYGPVIEALMGQEMTRQNSSYEQQLQQSDPMYQAKLQGAQLSNAQAMQPAVPEYDFMNMDDGTLIRTDNSGNVEPMGQFGEQPTRPMTPDERLSFGIPESDATPYVMGPDGPKAIGGGGVNTTINMPGQDKFDEAFASGDAATFSQVSDSGLAAQRNLGRIDTLQAALEASPSGAEAVFKQALGERGINTEGLDTIQAATALINSLVPEQRPPGSGPMSDADLALFKQSLPRLVNQPGGNAQIIATMRGIAQYDAAGAQVVQQVREGGMSRAQGFAALQARENPLAGVKATGDASGSAPPLMSGNGFPSAKEIEEMAPEDLIRMYGG